MDWKKLGIKTDRGKIVTDKQFQTNITGIRAIGDVISGPMLAHKAEEEGIAVANLIANKSHFVNYNAIPSVLYTYPEVAWVGATEEQLTKDAIDYIVGEFPMSANSRTKTNGESEGYVKILSCKKTGNMLGAHIVASNAGEMISEAVLAIEHGLKSEKIGLTCHAHPSLSEAFKEACMISNTSKAIHT